MKTFIGILLCFFTLIASGQVLEVKQGRTAIVKDGPSGNAPEIATLSAGTRVTMLGSVPRYYSIQFDNGRVGWSYKGNFLEVTGAPPATNIVVTAEMLLARTDVLKIIILDVEVGDSALIICPEENGERDVILIDAGESNDGGRIRQELVNQGFSLTGRPITRFFASHYDNDHIGPIAQIAPLCQVVYDHGPNNDKSFYRNAMTASSADRRTIALTYQETFSGGVNIDCVAVNRRVDGGPTISASSDDNDNSIALQIAFRGFDYFTAGDLTFSTESALVGVARNCDVYHVNHHGSRTTSSGIEFLRAIDPEVSVASNGTRHGHPTADVANRLITDIASRFYQTNVNPDDRANHPDPKFVADDTFHSDSDDENDEGAAGNITIVIDPVANRYYVIMPGLPLTEATFPIEL